MMTNAILWAKIVGAVATAFVTYSLGVKRSYLLGLCLIGTSIFIPMINSFYPLIAIRFMNGLGGAICLVSLVPVVSRYFDTNTSAKVNSFNGTSKYRQFDYCADISGEAFRCARWLEGIACFLWMDHACTRGCLDYFFPRFRA